MVNKLLHNKLCGILNKGPEKFVSSPSFVQQAARFSALRNKTKILVVYYSKTGNTERVAKDMAEKLNANVEKIVDKKGRSGILGYIFSGRDAMKKRLTEIETKIDPGNYDLVIVGTPVWGWNMVPAVRTYLEQVKERLKKVAFFTTSSNTNPRKIVVGMEKLSDKKALCFIGFSESELRDGKIYEGKLSAFAKTIQKLLPA